MFIKRKDIDIEKILVGAEFLGSGASKEAYLKDGIVYKVPRGRYVLARAGFGTEIEYPDTMADVDSFLEKVCDYEEQLVWPLGQFAIEILVWEALQALEKEGVKLEHFARIKDYYIDKNGVIVIEQEATDGGYSAWEEAENKNGDIWGALLNEINHLEPILKERFNISLRDVRDGNAGIIDGRAVLFDFGISTTTSLDDYGSYSDYCDDCCDSYDDEGSY